MLIDTHCHLNFKAFKKDLDKVINDALKSGVEKIIIPGAKIKSSEEALKIAKNYPNCSAAIGIHPHHASSFFTSILYSNVVKNEIKEKLSFLAKQPKVVAIGEIGLDYYQYKDCPAVSKVDKKNQKELFLQQVEIAMKCHLPVIIHCREAFDDMLNDLNHFILKYQNISGVFHCFSGNKKQLKEVLNMGFYVGFDGNITYPENKHLSDLIRVIPLDRLLLETDSPFLTPLPYRGKRNKPAYIKYIASHIAKIKEQKMEKIAEITSSNATKLFRL
ncbi:MAG: hypothetical protein ACD_7C00069G0001 [uncultured bacterium]|nr:MAG: hypothetical protein ACD_7C00069G0001 [uncultured bacterium]